MNNENIPTSGDYLRIFGRTDMTGGAMRIAMILAGHISFNGCYRGAPKGYAAFTMAELEDMAHMCARSIRRALDELASLFGLTIQRRHHDRHLFQFADICDAQIVKSDADESAENPSVTRRSINAVKQGKDRVTGHQSPVTLYTRTKSNNHTASMIRILRECSSVHGTPYAEIIENAKRGTDAEKMDTQFLWQGFHLLNARNERSIAPVSWLIAFVRKAKPIFETRPTKTKAPVTQSVCTDPLLLMAKPARFDNRAFHERDLIRAIGAEAYERRITEMQKRYRATRFAATRAVHGQAVKNNEIKD